MSQIKAADDQKRDDHGEGLWLGRYPEAKDSLLKALEDVKAGKFSENPPDVDVEEPWMAELEEPE
jgi:hypothetical protein